MTSDGTWNAAHFKNPEYDQLAKGYIAALDLESQRATAGQIQRLLLAGDAAVVRLFLRLPDRDTKGVTGVEPTAMSQIFLGAASGGR